MATATAQCQRSWGVQAHSPAFKAHRSRCIPLCAKKSKQQGNVKVNKRGKASSRPSPGSPVLEQALAAQQAAAPPQPTPAAATTPQQQQQEQVAPVQQSQPVASSSQRAGITETPQVVVDRMFKRVLTFTGAPVILGMFLFPAFWYLKVCAAQRCNSHSRSAAAS
eukprot:GHRR01013539.1.p1 GENE.GHRR01013539.1~~GHRR01013539.1.p1  ORF type:complete len:165 (+),score=66.92 GHRR01013539.1:387-881(+)